MELTDLTVRLLIIFFPGIICFLIVEALTVHRERKLHEILIFSYIFGIICYIFYGLLSMALGIKISIRAPWIKLGSWDVSFFKWLSDSKAQLDFLEIVSVTAIALILAFILSYCDKRKLLHVIAYRLKVTNKFGEPDVWNLAFNMEDARWCVVRDLPNKLMFQGYVRAFSDVGEVMELLLTQVNVYNEQTTELCYQADRIYLARKKDELTIEFRLLSRICGWISAPVDRQGCEIARLSPHRGSGNHTPFSWSVSACC